MTIMYGQGDDAWIVEAESGGGIVRRVVVARSCDEALRAFVSFFYDAEIRKVEHFGAAIVVEEQP